MSFLTPRQRGLAVVAGVIVAAAVFTALTGRTSWALSLSAVLLGAIFALLLDVRHRQQADGRGVRRVEAAVASLSDTVASLSDTVASLSDTVASLSDTVSRGLGELRSLATVSNALEELSSASEARHDETTRQLAHLDYEPVNEVQALLQLLPKLPPHAPPVPGVGGWALSASSILGIWGLVERERPATIVECGSGTSTMWLGYAARAVGGVKVVALEHKAAFVRQTEQLLAEHGLQDVAEVRHAPLHEVTADGEVLRWYDEGRLADVSTIDLLLVDGPPKSIGPLARFPAVPLLKDKLAPGAAIVVDDARRPDEQEAVARWSEHHGVSFDRRLSRDAALLRHTRSSPPVG